ncbi:hypothetical protein [Sigmofec virus UA08Rod_4258]|uniref:Uncharacterized protein n=1 Tax=Sigmofec virus UA08Rod_4258 TaxID=2929397 RepID=A0A976R8N2_9VIRU|nr:hypothetical protein [Sigmofec virus UA08Rod_4258]
MRVTVNIKVLVTFPNKESYQTSFSKHFRRLRDAFVFIKGIDPYVNHCDFCHLDNFSYSKDSCRSFSKHVFAPLTFVDVEIFTSKSISFFLFERLAKRYLDDTTARAYFLHCDLPF